MRFFSISKYNSFIVYIKDGWNKLDLLGIFIYLIAFSIHLIPHFNEFENDQVEKNLHEIAK